MAADVYDFAGANGNTIAGTGITLTGSGSATYDDTWSIGTSSTSGKFAANTGQVREARLAITSPSLTFWLDDVFEIPTLPAIGSGVRHQVVSVRSGTATSGAVICSVQVSELGTLVLVNTGGQNNFSAAGFVAGDKVRVSVGGVVGTTTSNGQVTAKAYTSASNFTVQSGSGFSSSALNLGTLAASFVGAGAGTAITGGLTVRHGLVRVESGRTTEFSAPPTAGATTAAITYPDGAGTQYPEVNTSVRLSLATSTVSGTPTYNWVCTSRSPGAPLPQINNATSQICTVVIPDSNQGATPPVYAGAQYEITGTITGTGGSDDDITVIYAHEKEGVSGQKTGVHSVTPGPWTLIGSGDPAVLLNDGLASTGIGSPDGPTIGQVASGTFRPLNNGPVTLFAPSEYDGSPLQLKAQVFMEDGTTLVDEGTFTLTDAQTTQSFIFDPAGNSAIGGVYSTKRALKFKVAAFT